MSWASTVSSRSAARFALNAGNYDSLTKTFFLAPTPVQGLLKIFSLPPVSLRPESWVPATVASYQTLSWDLDNAYNAINDLVNKFQPGMLNVLEQQLVGPNGGQPLSFQKDVFGPLGDRITMISDFKKPIKEDSQRMLVAVALEDAKAFQNTLNRVIELAGARPRSASSRGRRSTTSTSPNLPKNAGARQPPGLQGPDQHGDRQGHPVPDHRHDPARTGPPAGRRAPGRQRDLPDASPRRSPKRSAA